MLKQISGVFIDPENNIAEVRTIEHSLQGFYQLLRCDIIEMPERRLGDDRYFTFICDEEALLKSNCYVSALDPMGNAALVGPLFVVRYDGSSEVCSLSEEEALHILSHVVSALAVQHSMPRITCMLYGIEY